MSAYEIIGFAGLLMVNDYLHRMASRQRCRTAALIEKA